MREEEKDGPKEGEGVECGKSLERDIGGWKAGL